MKRGVMFWGAAVLGLVLCQPIGAYGEIIKWVDDDGKVHFADSPAQVPAEFRGKVEEKKYRPEGRSTVGTVPAQGTSTAAPGEDADNDKKKPKLKRFVVPYKPLSRGARRILLNVTFNNKVTAPMILDTGAPGLVISARLARKIGIFSNSDGKLVTRAGGLGGSQPAIRTIIDSVRIGGAEDKFVPTTITRSISRKFEGLVGLDFLANYSLTVDSGRQAIILKQMPKSKKRPGGHDKLWWRMNFNEFSSMRNGWKKEKELAVKALRSGNLTESETKDLRNYKKYADYQQQEAAKLFRKLDNYAARHSVPMKWRIY